MKRALAGCLSLSLALPAFASETQPLKVAVVEVPIQHAVKKLKMVSSEPRPKDKDEERRMIASKLHAAENDAKVGMIESLEWKGRVVVLKDAATTALADSLNLANGDRDIPLDALNRFHRETGSDAVLRFRISDYGRTPRNVMTWIYAGTAAWIAGVITLSVVNPKTRPYIGAYIGSEVAQEGAEFYLGTSFFGHEYKPVRIEAELINTNDGRVLWSDALTRTASGKIIKLYPEKERQRRELQLGISADRAVLGLADSLAARLSRITVQ